VAARSALVPELVFVGLGIGLRLVMALGYDVGDGYDFAAHQKYVAWLVEHAALPPLDHSRATYHPPLYYLIAAGLVGRGASYQGLAWLSALFGSLRLVLIWLGLRGWLPAQAGARRAALLLAVVLPVALHLDGMVNPEALLGLLAAAALVLVRPAFSAEGRWRWAAALALGLVVGLGLLTKLSMLAFVAALALGSLAWLVWDRPRPIGARLGRLAPLAVALALAALVSGAWLVRSARLAGTPFVSAFDAREAALGRASIDRPYLRRRPPGYVLCWTLDIYRAPQWPAAVEPAPRFWPLLVASTFADYYGYRFAPRRWHLDKRWSLALARASVTGGTLVALITALAFLAVGLESFRRRDAARVALLLVPLVALVLQLHLAVKYPVDALGPVKGAYLAFVSPVLCGLFGLAVAWAWRRGGWARLAAALGLLALAPIAAYTLVLRIAAL
jgi:hypothetical protein